MAALSKRMALRWIHPNIQARTLVPTICFSSGLNLLLDSPEFQNIKHLEVPSPIVTVILSIRKAGEILNTQTCLGIQKRRIDNQ